MTAEDRDAIAFVAAFGAQWPFWTANLLHIKNETPKPGKERGGAFAGLIQKQRRMGTRKGVSDYFLAVPIGEFHGLFLELKAEGGTVKPEQVAFLEEMRERGYAAACAWTWTCAMTVASRYMDGKLSRRGVLGCSPTAPFPVVLSALTMGGKVRTRRIEK